MSDWEGITRIDANARTQITRIIRNRLGVPASSYKDADAIIRSVNLLSGKTVEAIASSANIRPGFLKIISG